MNEAFFPCRKTTSCSLRRNLGETVKTGNHFMHDDPSFLVESVVDCPPGRSTIERSKVYAMLRLV